MVLNKAIKVLRRWRPTRSVLLESKYIPEEALLFESGSLAVLTPPEVDLIRKDYPDADSAYAFLGVLQVGTRLSYIVMVTGCIQVGKIQETEVYRVTNTLVVPLHPSPQQHEGVVAMGKLLASGQFYFSVCNEENPSFSLLSRAQVKNQDQLQFCWNRSLYVYLQRFGVDCNRWVIPILCGSVQIQTVYAGDKQVKACLISRVSCERAGTRFNVRGLNDEGNVANFVETEQALYMDGGVASFVQVRGLVPVFWDQPGIQTGTNRIRLSRGFHCSHLAFERHFEKLFKDYGPLLCVDLLGDRDMEPLLSEAYIEHLERLELRGAAEYVSFDYHLHCRPGHTEALETILLPQCSRFLDNCRYFLELDGVVEVGQTGTLRLNCLDCLDRSNNTQIMFGLEMLKQQLEGLRLSTKASILTRFKQLYQRFWLQNGDTISKLYAGTGALGKKNNSKVELIRNRARTVQRTIVNNFMDSSKQEAIDILLLNGYVGEIGLQTRALLSTSDLLAPLPLRRGLTERWQEYTIREKLRVCIGTWNVNGGKHIRSIALKNHSMHDWLLDAPTLAGKAEIAPDDYCAPADIYAIGFQELVGLTASNLVSTSSTNRHQWGAELQRVLSRDEEYSLVTAEQLVGVCLYVFVRPHLIPYIRDVGVSAVKTGIGGKAGNKGGVAIRLLLHSTSLCFVCSHFAAHQTKILERNQDFADVYRRVQFPLNQSIDSHDYVFWCGDLNYRIELPTTLAKDYITKQEWEKLVHHDQLTKQKKLGKVFQGFAEGNLSFAPTYKYDEFSDDYDTSEKCRVPAWCDRILWRRKSFLPPLDQQMLARLRDEEKRVDTTGEYGWHPNNAQKVYERELTSGSSNLSWWHPGSLLHYGRAELKTSDHRPVVALLEIDVFHINEKERERVRSEVAKQMGPADATVIVKPVGVAYNSLNTIQLVKAFQQYGDIVLVRVTDEATLITFKNSQSALKAVTFTGQEVDNVPIDVKLRSVDDGLSGDNLRMLTAAELTTTNIEQNEENVIEEELIFAAEELEEDDIELIPSDVVPVDIVSHDTNKDDLEQSTSSTPDDEEDENTPKSISQLSQSPRPYQLEQPRPKPLRPPRHTQHQELSNLETSDQSSVSDIMSPDTGEEEHSTLSTPDNEEESPHSSPQLTLSPESDQPRPKPLRPPRPPAKNGQPMSEAVRPSLKPSRPPLPNIKPKRPERPPPISKPRSHTVGSVPPPRPERPPPPYTLLYPNNTNDSLPT